MRAVRFDRYGDGDVLDVREVDDPVDAPGRVVVEVRTTGINPGEIAVRQGVLHERWPATFPSGEGSDLAGVVRSVGAGVDSVAVGDEVVGWSDERSAHAELVSLPEEHVVPKPAGVPWEVAGSVYVAGMAGLACVRAVAPAAGEVVAVSAAAGGVGSFAAQLARRTGAMVIGLAGEANHDWLRSRSIVPIRYGDGQAERIRAAAGDRVDAFIDTFGGGYVDLALELGVPADRINTVIDYEAVATKGVKGEGTASVASATSMREVLDAVAAGDVEVPIAATFALDDVRDAYPLLAERHTRGKIVLLP